MERKFMHPCEVLGVELELQERTGDFGRKLGAFGFENAAKNGGIR
jgi:hypothetical protein